jgi:hypothetical protein
VNAYVTIAQLKAYLGITSTDDDNLFRQFTIESSRLFDAFCHRKFYPRTATLNFDYQDPFQLTLNDDLLAITTLTTSNDGDSGSAITASQYMLMRGEDHNRTPYNTVAIDQSTTANFDFFTTPRKSQQIVGTWGFHDDWSNAWTDSSDTVQDGAGINASVTTVTVSAVSGSDIYNVANRFQEQQLLKIESEYLYVTAVNNPANTLTVIRGMNGTTAATHANGTTISIFQTMHDIVAAMRVLVTHQYRRRDSIGEETDRPLVTGDGVLIMPSSLPAEVKSRLKQYMRRM